VHTSEVQENVGSIDALPRQAVHSRLHPRQVTGEDLSRLIARRIKASEHDLA